MILKIAFRNIFRQKRRTILTALAMIVGFTLCSIVIGWSDGAYSNIIKMFTGNRIGHIQIHKKGYHAKPSIYGTIDNQELIDEVLSSVKGVEKWTPRLYAAGLGSVDEKSTAIQILGIDVVRESQATQFDKQVVQGRMLSENASHEALIGQGLARTLSANLGSNIVIFSQAADGSIANDEYTVVGITDSGDDTTDRVTCYLHINEAQDLFVLEERVHEIVVIVSKIKDVTTITASIQEQLNDPSLEVLPWYEVAKSFYNAMKTDQQGDAISRLIIILIVAIGVLNTVMMSVLERTREYGVLKAVGTKPIQIFWLVVTEVVIIALGSIIIGALLGVLCNYLLSIYGFKLPQDFSYGGIRFGTMYAEVNIRSLIIPTVTVLFSAVLVSCFPAIKAARIMPAKAMRTH